MPNVPDPYRLLGVSRGASAAQIKAAHRALAKRYHPDAPDGDTDRFLAVQEAYGILSDPLRRREWDARHAPGPVRAGEGTMTRPRPRAESGRWTREDGTAHRARPGEPYGGRGTSRGHPGTAPGRRASDRAGSSESRAAP